MLSPFSFFLSREQVHRSKFCWIFGRSKPQLPKRNLQNGPFPYFSGGSRGLNKRKKHDFPSLHHPNSKLRCVRRANKQFSTRRSKKRLVMLQNISSRARSDVTWWRHFPPKFNLFFFFRIRRRLSGLETWKQRVMNVSSCITNTDPQELPSDTSRVFDFRLDNCRLVENTKPREVRLPKSLILSSTKQRQNKITAALFKVFSLVEKIF